MLELICISSFATVCLLVIGLTMRGETAIIQQRLNELTLTGVRDDEVVALAEPFGDRVFRPWLAGIASLFSRLMPAAAMANIDVKLDRAGLAQRLRAHEFVGVNVLSILVFAGAGVAYAVLSSAPFAHRVLAVVVALIIGLSLPNALLSRAIRERHRLIRKSLSDCLDLLVVSTEAGLAFDGALKKVVERIRGPLADEFNRVLDDMSIGRSRAEALKLMSDRVELPELTTFVGAIRWADLLGTSMAQVLRIQADNLRTQRHIRARETAAKLPLKMLFPLVFFVFPSIFIVILVPGAIKIIEALTGVTR